MMKLTIGIIGTGRFATVLNMLLSRNPDWQIKHSSTTKSVDGRTIVSLTELAKCQVIIPAVPISALPQVLKQLTDQIPPGHSPLVMSVCSVMSAPENWLLTELPARMDVLITHPLFGPKSSLAGKKFAHLKWIWHPARIKNRARLLEFEAFLQRQKLAIIPMTSGQHDQLMARTQLWSFVVGQLGIGLGLKPTQLDTVGFEHVLKNQAIVATDSHQLFIDLCTHNPHARKQLDQCNWMLSQWQVEILENKKSPTLDELRLHIDHIDQQLLGLLSQRFAVVKKVGELKKQLNIPPLQPKRWHTVMENVLKTAHTLNLPVQLVQDVWNRIHSEAVRLEKAVEASHEL